MRIKSIRIEKINNDGTTTSKIIWTENAKKHLEILNGTELEHTINKIKGIKYKSSKKNEKETPPQFLLRKLKNFINRRTKLLSINTNWSAEELEHNENQINEYYKKYLIEKDRLKKSKTKKISTGKFGTSTYNSILSINSKRNEH